MLLREGKRVSLRELEGEFMYKKALTMCGVSESNLNFIPHSSFMARQLTSKELKDIGQRVKDLEAAGVDL